MEKTSSIHDSWKKTINTHDNDVVGVEKLVEKSTITKNCMENKTDNNNQLHSMARRCPSMKHIEIMLSKN